MNTLHVTWIHDIHPDDEPFSHQQAAGHASWQDGLFPGWEQQAGEGDGAGDCEGTNTFRQLCHSQETE